MGEALDRRHVLDGRRAERGLVAAAAEAMADAAGGPAAQPVTAEAFERLDEMLGAVAAGDQEAFDDAAAAGLAWWEYPVLGWASAAELRQASDHAEEADDGMDVDDEDVEPLHALVRAVRQAARFGLDLVSAYG